MFRMSMSVCALICLALSLFGCAGSLQYEVNPHYEKAEYRRVGLLVVRVANQAGCFPPVPITLQTNYANRHSELPSGFFVKSETHDVYIEEEGRLHESLPSYPYCSRVEKDSVLAKGSYTTFFRNITPQLTIHIGQFLAGKGYGVVDLRTVAATWDKPMSEMTVDELLGRSRGIVNAVFIFHYRDLGEYSLRGAGVAAGGSEGTGLTSISYSGAMFDVATKERILSFTPSLGGNPNVIEAIAHDPEILADPLRRGKVVNPSYNHWKLLFSDEEIVELVAKYICYGVKWGWSNQWTGLNVIVP